MSYFCLTEDLLATNDGGEVAMVSASGEIDCRVSPQLGERIHQHIARGRRRILLDLSQVTFIDSMTIGVIMGAVAQLQALGGGSLTVVCAEENARVLRILDIAGVASAITLYHRRADALADLSATTPLAGVAAWMGQATAGQSTTAPTATTASEPGSPDRSSRLRAARKYAREAAASSQRQADGGSGDTTGRQINELA